MNENETKHTPGPCRAQPPAAQGAEVAPVIDWRHIANEYADAVANGIQWLRNIRDGISSFSKALEEMESNLKRIGALQRPITGADAKGEVGRPT